MKALFYKIAKLRLTDIEDELGYYFNDKQEPNVRKMVGHQNAKRFGLRHPVLTGIPTLGIWPATSKGNAKDEVIRNLLRKDLKLQKIYRKVKKDRDIAQQHKDAVALGKYRTDQITGAVETVFNKK